MCYHSNPFHSDKVNFWGEKRDYYHFLTQSISGRKDLEQEAKKIQGFPKVSYHWLLVSFDDKCIIVHNTSLTMYNTSLTMYNTSLTMYNTGLTMYKLLD